MKTLQHDNAPRQRNEETRKRPARAAAFAALLVAAPMALASCGPDCAVGDGCDTRDFNLSLGVGEERETVTDGAILRVKVLDITQTVKPDGAATCKATGGSATIRIRVETDPVYEQDLVIGPSMCFALASSCMSINDVEITQDLGNLDADTGTCEVTNEKANFTLEIGR